MQAEIKAKEDRSKIENDERLRARVQAAAQTAKLRYQYDDNVDGGSLLDAVTEAAMAVMAQDDEELQMDASSDSIDDVPRRVARCTAKTSSRKRPVSVPAAPRGRIVDDDFGNSDIQEDASSFQAVGKFY